MILRVKDKNGNVIEIPAIKGDTGKPGASGYTPIKGVDYYTAEDKNEIISNVKDALGTIYEFAGSVADEEELYSLSLPESDAGKVYNVVENGMNYAWTGSSWDALGMVYNITDTVSSTSDALITSRGVSTALEDLSYDDLNDIPFAKHYVLDKTVLDYIFSDGLTGWVNVKEYSGIHAELINNSIIRVNYSRMGIVKSFDLKVDDGDTYNKVYEIDCEYYGKVAIKYNPTTNIDFTDSTYVYVNLDGIVDFNSFKDTVSIEIFRVDKLDEDYLPDTVASKDFVTDAINEAIDDALIGYDNSLMSILGG